MQKIRLIAVGTLKEKYLADAVAEYAKRLKRFCYFEILELPERKTLEQEASDIVKHVSGALAIFDVKGTQLTSEDFSDKIRWFNDMGHNLTFVIGSSHGLSDTVKQEAVLSISLSRMTFPHQLARVICCEQIYRAFMIMSGGKYHK